MSETVYSTNNEQFYSEIESACDGIFEELGVHEIYEGVSLTPTVLDFVDVSDIIERIKETAYDEYDDLSEGYLDDITIKNKQDLKNIIADWFNNNGFNPTFYRATNIKKIKIKLTLKDGCENYEILHKESKEAESEI